MPHTCPSTLSNLRQYGIKVSWDIWPRFLWEKNPSLMGRMNCLWRQLCAAVGQLPRPHEKTNRRLELTVDKRSTDIWLQCPWTAQPWKPPISRFLIICFSCSQSGLLFVAKSILIMVPCEEGRRRDKDERQTRDTREAVSHPSDWLIIKPGTH